MLRGQRWLPSVTLASVGIAVLFASCPTVRGQSKKAVKLSSSSGLLFSDGIVVGNTLYISGQEGKDSAGKLQEGIGGQTHAALEAIRNIAVRAGFSMNDVVTVNVYLSDIHDFSEMNKIYATFFPDPKPARTTIQAAALVNGAKVEISAVAARR